MSASKSSLIPTDKSAPDKAAPETIFMNVEDVSVTFPSNGALVTEPETTHDERVVLSSRGKVIGIRALNHVSLRLEQGDRLAIIGRNGSGKTTLLQTLAGILAPDAGQISWRGRVTSLININLGVQVEASGHRNITLRGLAAGYTRKQIEEKRQAIAEFCELGEFLDMPMEVYSSGMKMRLIFAIATAFDPEILILDEWLSAGDVVFKRKATERMSEFVDKAGILILASHSRKLLVDNCEKAIWLKDGRIQETGPTEDIFDAYEASELASR